jgi:DNA adenine methylase
VAPVADGSFEAVGSLQRSRSAGRFARSRPSGHTGGVAAPFLKWAGGKARLVPRIAEQLPGRFGRYHEPFLGAGAVFFALHARGPLPPSALNDANGALIDTFVAVRDHAGEVVEALRELSEGYLALAPAERAVRYYAIRASEPRGAVAAAARFIFLNRTCYNGLFRVNRAGRFNVPHGRYVRPTILNEANLREAAGALAGARLTCDDFEEACARAEPGDMVYLDPPYHPLSATSRFTAYTSGDFGWAEQERLARVFGELTHRRVYAVLSNSAHEEIAALYSHFAVSKVPMSRAINSVGSRRQPVAEFLISNVAMVEGR